MIEKALTNGEHCSLILLTVTASRGAMNRLMAENLEGHIRHHLLNPAGNSSDEQAAAADEVIRLVRTYLNSLQNPFMRLLMRQFLAILLSAAVLATAMLPPAVCHSHQGGDVQHAHSAADRHSHPHGPESHEASHHATAESAHSHERSAERSSKQAGDHAHGLEPAAAHRHLRIAGFDFTIPQPAGNGPGRGDDEGCSDATAVVRLTGESVTVRSVEPDSPFDLPVLAGDAAALSEAASSTLRSLLEPAGDRSLLCDTARLERSGVLLI